MGFEDVFDIESSAASLLPTLLNAHRTLMSMNERNQELFSDVVSLLEQASAGQ